MLGSRGEEYGDIFGEGQSCQLENSFLDNLLPIGGSITQRSKVCSSMYFIKMYFINRKSHVSSINILASNLAPLSLSFLIFKVEVIVIPLRAVVRI